MAAGVWTDPLYDSFGIKPGYRVRMSKGAHIVVPGSAIKSNTGVIIKTDLSVLFIIPWGDKWIVGTTDTDYNEDPAAPLATREDVNYILAQANRVLEPKLDKSQVIGVFAGLRPLVSSDPDSATTELSREHVVDHPVPGFVTIAGGKYTTYRVMSRDAVDSAVGDLMRIVPDSCTEGLTIIGAEGYSVLLNKADDLAKDYGVSSATILHLLDRYGSLFNEVLEPSILDKSWATALIDGLPYLRAEILYAVTHEGARSVDDVLSRRTRISFEAKDQGISVVEEVGEIISKVLGWSKSETQASVDQYLSIVEEQRNALTRTLRETV
jgi:glycerol-3-phosphate dehydrogenase